MDELDLAYMSIDTLKNRVNVLEKEVETLQAKIRKMIENDRKELADENAWRGRNDPEEGLYYWY
jgi:uncharacterized small protein (DUF1192 family)